MPSPYPRVRLGDVVTVQGQRVQWAPFIVAVVGLALAVGAAVFVGSGPSFVSENGTWGLTVLAIPILVNLFGLVCVTKGWRRTMITLATVLLGLCLLSGFSVGLFFLPAASLMLVASMTLERPS